MANWKNRPKYNVKTGLEEVTPKFRFSKLARRQVYVSVLSILAVFVVILGSTYAIFSSINKSKEYNTLNVGTLEIAYDDTSTGLGNIINLNGAYPVADVTGLTQTPYTFQITNTGSLENVYQISILDDINMITADGCSSNLLNKANIKVSIDGETPVLLSSLAPSYVIKTSTLKAGMSRNHTVRLWLDEGSSNEVLGKHYHGKIVISSVNTKDVLAEGEMVAFGGKFWNVIKEDGDIVTLILHGSAGNDALDTSSSNSWAGATLRTKLNDESTGFLSQIPSTYRSKIISQTVEGVTGKVRLATKAELVGLVGAECTSSYCYTDTSKADWLLEDFSTSSSGFWGQTWGSSMPLYMQSGLICQSCPGASSSYAVKPVIAVHKSDLEASYREYKIGDQVTLLDNSVWWVIQNSDKRHPFVTLLKDTSLNMDSDPAITSADYRTFDSTVTSSKPYVAYSKISTTNIGYYLENSYRPTLTSSLSGVSGNITYLKVRLMKLEEINKIPGVQHCGVTSYDSCVFTSDTPEWIWKRGHFWLMDSPLKEANAYVYQGGYPSSYPQYGEIYQNKSGSQSAGFRPVIEILKTNLK